MDAPVVKEGSHSLNHPQNQTVHSYRSTVHQMQPQTETERSDWPNKKRHWDE